MATFRRIFRLFWWIICCLAFIAIPLAVWDFTRKGYDIRYQAWFIGGIFAILSVPISTYGVAMHTEYYTRPRLQRHVIRILWMVPIYSVDAWFALRFRSAREYLDPIRECYEAYVIYNFFAYLMGYLEEELGDVPAHLARKPPMTHLPPFKWIMDPWPMGRPFLLQCKKGIMNYVILRPITTSIALITDIFGLFGQGRVDFGKSYVYLTATTNFSQLWALYCLGQMYWAVHTELAPIRPLSKFICIKSVVFLTFWQGTVLALLVSSGVIADDSWSSYEQIGVATGIQDFLICIEMFLAALAHSYAFPPKEYMHASDLCELDGGFLVNIRHMFDVRDVTSDIRTVVQQHYGTATDAVKHAVVTLPKTALMRTAKSLGLISGEVEDYVERPSSESHRLEQHGESGVYQSANTRESDDGGELKQGSVLEKKDSKGVSKDWFSGLASGRGGSGKHTHDVPLTVLDDARVALLSHDAQSSGGVAGQGNGVDGGDESQWSALPVGGKAGSGRDEQQQLQGVLPPAQPLLPISTSIRGPFSGSSKKRGSLAHLQELQELQERPQHTHQQEGRQPHQHDAGTSQTEQQNSRQQSLNDEQQIASLPPAAPHPPDSSPPPFSSRRPQITRQVLPHVLTSATPSDAAWTTLNMID